MCLTDRHTFLLSQAGYIQQRPVRRQFCAYAGGVLWANVLLLERTGVQSVPLCSATGAHGGGSQNKKTATYHGPLVRDARPVNLPGPRSCADSRSGVSL